MSGQNKWWVRDRTAEQATIAPAAEAQTTATAKTTEAASAAADAIRDKDLAVKVTPKATSKVSVKKSSDG